MCVGNLSFAQNDNQINKILENSEPLQSTEEVDVSKSSPRFSICEFNCNLRYSKGGQQWNSCMKSCK